MSKKLTDTAQIKVKAGNGGDGTVSFRREKFVPKGGPDGGNGGKGGSVYLQAVGNMSTLMDFKSKPSYKAEDGDRGGKQNKTGKDGSDLIIKIPLGTQVFLEEGNVLVGDMTIPGEKMLIASGGVGGKGNTFFKSSTNQTPMEYTKGTQGEEKTLNLEIKLIADVGFIGLPNAGKSTLINHMTSANAKTAQYPFTTIIPNLGACQLPDGSNIIIADIPGLIEGASAGKGLGDDFLRHVERTRLLVHLVDSLDGASDFSPENLAKNALEGYKKIRGELEQYKSSEASFERLIDKREILVINKIDITEVAEALPEITKAFENEGFNPIGLSAVTGEGVDKLMYRLVEELNSIPKPQFNVHKVTKVYNIENLPNKRVVFRKVTKKEERKKENTPKGKRRG